MAETKEKLVRARPKSVEYLPEWAKCCPSATIQLCSHSETLFVDVQNCLRAPAGLDKCQYCGAEVPACTVARLTCGCWYPIELLDLDEGPERPHACVGILYRETTCE